MESYAPKLKEFLAPHVDAGSWNRHAVELIPFFENYRGDFILSIDKAGCFVAVLEAGYPEEDEDVIMAYYSYLHEELDSRRRALMLYGQHGNLKLVEQDELTPLLGQFLDKSLFHVQMAEACRASGGTS
jgi:hypothetical protein